MARKKIQMHQYRQALFRMRQGDSDRTIADSKLMGRKTASHLRDLALKEGWLDKDQPLPAYSGNTWTLIPETLGHHSGQHLNTIL